MAGFSPAPLPSLSTLFDPSSANTVGAPAFIPSIGLVFGFTSGTRTLPGSAGAYALTGKSVGLYDGRKVTAAAGAFSETGQGATLTHVTSGFGVEAPAPLPSLSTLLTHDPNNKFVIASAGGYAVSGVAANLLKGRGIALGTGVFILSGAPALRDLQVTSDRATYAMTGNAATLTKVSPGIGAATGVFTLTGVPAGLVYQSSTASVLSGARGVFVLTGNAAQLPSTIARKLVCDRGSFVSTGSPATMRFVGWAPVDSGTGTWTNVSQVTTTWTDAP